jgi:wyosine [tRNA(Phe)-imidazoG37] synthetase (radical SAM superfamily)
MTHTVQDASHYLKTEPRIWLIKQQLENILNLVDLEKDGKIVEVDGFRLKNLSNWADCSSSLYSNMGSVSGYCNADCIFCYEKGNPLPFVRDILSLEEVRTRIAYYSHDKEKGLPIPTRVHLEPFCNPHFLKILKLTRESDSDSVFRILTNGGLLTEDVIKELSWLQPILLSISLNSADPLIRNKVMREPRTHTKTALASIPLLQKHKIIFLGSIVAWPSIPLDDLIKTVEFLDRHDARVIRVLLPSYTQYFSDHHLFDTDKVWQNMVTMLRDLRQRIRTPLYCQPSFFWNEPLTPVVDGVIKRSPAAESGLLAGDTILTINDHTVHTRVHAAKLLSDSYNESGSVHMLVSRKGKEIRVDLEETPADECYPYKLKGIPLVGPHFGIFFIDDFKLTYIQELINLIENHNAHHVVLLSSKIMRPVVIKAIRMVEDFRSYFSTRSLTIHVPPHLFWGGNILLGDLYTVRDYGAYITALLRTHDSIPDLLVIPVSSISKWSYDLLDQSFTEIEQQFSIPIEFIRCEPIYL